MQTIATYVNEIPSMGYKTDLEENIRLKTEFIIDRYGRDIKIAISSSERSKAYSSEEIDRLITFKRANIANQIIANELGRTYWSIVYNQRA